RVGVQGRRRRAGHAQGAADLRGGEAGDEELQVSGMKLTLKVWRQKDRNSPGRLETYEATDVRPDMSLLEMLDIVNEKLIEKGQEPIAFEHDCREGICGACS